MTRRIDELGTGEVRIGVSSCLLGAAVRYDGGHKHDPFLTGTVGGFVTLVPVCPEVEVGFGVPRPTLRLVEADGGIRLRFSADGRDVTALMRRFARRRVRELRRLDLSGYVLKSKSPSCGLERVPVRDRTGVARAVGRGLFAEALTTLLPHLPVEEEVRLHDPVLCETFFERVFGYRRVHDLFAGRWVIADLVRFHAREEMVLRAHDPQAYRRLARQIDEATGRERRVLAADYAAGHGAALARPATRAAHVRILRQAARSVERRLAASERAELARALDAHAAGLAQRIVPATLLRQLAIRCGVESLLEQHYLAPHPRERMLRDHA